MCPVIVPATRKTVAGLEFPFPYGLDCLLIGAGYVFNNGNIQCRNGLPVFRLDTSTDQNIHLVVFDQLQEIDPGIPFCLNALAAENTPLI